MKVVISNGIHASTAFALYNTFTSAVGSQRIDWLVLRSAMNDKRRSEAPENSLSEEILFINYTMKYHLVIGLYFSITGDKTNDCKNLARLRST